MGVWLSCVANTQRRQFRCHFFQRLNDLRLFPFFHISCRVTRLNWLHFEIIFIFIFFFPLKNFLKGGKILLLVVVVVKRRKKGPDQNRGEKKIKSCCHCVRAWDSGVSASACWASGESNQTNYQSWSRPIASAMHTVGHPTPKKRGRRCTSLISPVAAASSYTQGHKKGWLLIRSFFFFFPSRNSRGFFFSLQ